MIHPQRRRNRDVHRSMAHGGQKLFRPDTARLDG
jgi:hypothetical protein